MNATKRAPDDIMVKATDHIKSYTYSQTVLFKEKWDNDIHFGYYKNGIWYYDTQEIEIVGDAYLNNIVAGVVTYWKSI